MTNVSLCPTSDVMTFDHNIGINTQVLPEEIKNLCNDAYTRSLEQLAQWSLKCSDILVKNSQSVKFLGATL